MLPQSRNGPQPRVAAFRGYPGKEIVKGDRNPNGVVSISQPSDPLEELSYPVWR